MTEIHGLTQETAEKKLQEIGLNAVPEPKFSFFKAFMSGLWNLSAWILEGAILLEIALGKGIQASFVLAMLLFAALNSAIQKKRSRRVLSSISHQLTPTVAVERDGKWSNMDSKYLVPGDLINLKAGAVLPADVEIKTGSLTIDESSITGESKPAKHSAGETAFAGTTVVKGNSLAIVTATGAKSRSGKTINLINKSAAPGHLQQLLTRIIFYLCLLDSALTLILLIAAIIRRENVLSMLPFLGMMFIAAIPVAMPSTFALSNSFEATRLSKEGVLTSDLTGIQDAANLNLLLLDKTGTITENKTAVAEWHVFNEADPALSNDEILQLAAAATDTRGQSIIDSAILEFLQTKKLALLKPTTYQPFTPDRGYSEAQVGQHNVKLGSFKRLSLIDETANQQVQAIDFQAGRSVAVLIDDHLAGVFILQDQVRPDSQAALAELQQRGIKPVMLTGDNQRTAAAVAKQVRLTGRVVSINDFDENSEPDLKQIAGIADVLPEDKLEIVKFFQAHGYIVGMTGDGINDAAALKQAEVGIAVASAADVAKRSSKMVLLDEGLTPILKILDAGHRVYERMTTWSLTKLTRTAELTTLLTLGYLVFGYLPMVLNAMVIYTIMNNLVTMMIGTDRTQISHQPENWDMAKLSRFAFSLAAGWIIAGFGLVWGLTASGWRPALIKTMIYCFMVISGMLILLITRTRKFFWQDYPSKWVAGTQIADVIVTCGLALFGIAMTKISLGALLLTAVVALVAAIIIDFIYKKFIYFE
ncbi:MAG: HAD-IC family P-type ATPase [Lactobacillus sp.]|jgi:magnesium-transporting ATPase (P-type)|nr:HAD-IC family P-type ATPase [Lactobacillus sp.]MCH3906189.1 HAD-IC family P-type ATPase [Lactobacillus sp.]MCH3990234.1 HAD-IC family P-type ATPase [Lactobacillus sp.]MCH4069052.1 HAD-IC family P-type ATPase [Lactobacillus sp.]MCI1303454.1 HAD-IC family P-type ATPase [Lactobacillus sp.]